MLQLPHRRCRTLLRSLVLTTLARWVSSQSVSEAALAQQAQDTAIVQAGGLVTTECRASYTAMLNNKDYLFMENLMWNWCRIRMENKMATCCTNAEFAVGRSDSCDSDCVADCVHPQMAALCTSYFGKACSLSREPFSENDVSFKVMETICIPEECDNKDDLDSGYLMKWYHVAFKDRRYGQNYRFNYQEVTEFACPGNTVMIIMIVVGSSILIVAAIPLGFFLFKAPKERGRVLAGSDDDSYYETAVEPMPGAPAMLNATDSSGLQNRQLGY